MDKTTAAGRDPVDVAHCVLKAVNQRQKDVLLAGLVPTVAVYIRTLWPALFFKLMASRARKEQRLKDEWRRGLQWEKEEEKTQKEIQVTETGEGSGWLALATDQRKELNILFGCSCCFVWTHKSVWACDRLSTTQSHDPLQRWLPVHQLWDCQHSALSSRIACWPTKMEYGSSLGNGYSCVSASTESYMY